MIDHVTLLHPVLLQPLDAHRMPKLANVLAMLFSAMMLLLALG